MTLDKDYTDGLSYEHFIRRTFKVDRHSRKIGHWGDTYDIVFKKTMDAVNKFLTRRLNKVEREALSDIKTKMYKCYSKSDLIKLIHEALDATQRHKEYRPK